MAKKETQRLDVAPRRDGRERIIEKVREQERKAVEKAMDAIIEVYGPALKELEKY